MADPVRIAVIMAGGAGERFWPLSRCNRPKQLLPLGRPDKSLLREAVDRLLGVFGPDRIFVVTGRHLQQPIREADVGIPPENVLAEPSKKNTSGCLVYAAAALLARLHRKPEDVTMAVVTADQKIAPDDAFAQTVRTAMEAAETENALVTIGIRPTRPETGYGYVEVDSDHTVTDRTEALPVARFREKPDRKTAEAYIEGGRHLWNSGMFFWTIATFLAELADANPQLAAIASELRAALTDDNEPLAEEAFARIPGQSIDYALMERARRVRVVPASFNWDDVGAWDALDRTFPRDENGNVTTGDPVLVDTSDCIVCNEPGAANTAVAVVGCEGLAVVVSADGILVVPKERAQDVKRAVARLREQGAGQL